VDFWRTDPGCCIVCRAAHSACGGGGPIIIEQRPAARDGAEDRTRPARVPDAGAVTLPSTPVTTGTYRRVKKAAAR
jgi:hypothetical protein